MVLVLTSMKEHGALTREALQAGKHVLVEKPMATSLEEARELVELSRGSRRAAGLRAAHPALPHLSRDARSRAGRRRRPAGAGPRPLRLGGAVVGPLVLPARRRRALRPRRLQPHRLCGFFGRVQRVTALVGTAIPERVVDGELVRVEADDNAHVLLDFGEPLRLHRHRLHDAAVPLAGIELYGTDGVLQMLGDDWAPEGFEQWRNEARHVGAACPRPTRPGPGPTACATSWTACGASRATVTRPEHAYHALEVMLAAMRAAREGRVIEIESDFPAPDYSTLPVREVDERRSHDPRSLL